jgi:hypothetical protein
MDRDPAAGSSRIDDRDTTPINDNTMTIRVAILACRQFTDIKCLGI